MRHLIPEEKNGFVARFVLVLLVVAYCVVRLQFDLRTIGAGALFIVLDYLMCSPPLGTRRPVRYLLILLQALVLAGVFLAPAPFGFAKDYPLPMVLFSPFLFLLLCFTAAHATVRRPLASLWAGLIVVGIWWAYRTLALADPATVFAPKFPLSHYKVWIDVMREANAPHFFNRGNWRWGEFALMEAAGFLFFVTWRLNWLARRTARRVVLLDTLAAYFPPQIAELLARSRKPGLTRWSKAVAVLDCDLVGFTSFAEKSSLEDVAAMLKAYRTVVEDAVFGCDGAIVAFTGDGVTAAFGLTDTVLPGAQAAVRCAQQIAACWHQTSGAADGAPAIAIGIDFGPVQSGLVGEERAVSLLLVGDCVKGAAQLQAMTRELGHTILISEAERQAAGTLPDIAFTAIAGPEGPIWAVEPA